MIQALRRGLSLSALAACLAVCGCATTIRGPELAVEYFNLGNAYYELGRYDTAITYYEKAVRLDRENQRARFNLALALLEAQRGEEALAVLRELSARDRENIEVRAALAYAYHVQGRDEEAVAEYSRLLAAAPGSHDARYNLGMILWAMGRPEQALHELLTLLESSPEDLPALVAAGTLLLELAQPEEAAIVLAEYLQARPDDAQGYLLLARAYRAQERYDRALGAYDTALLNDEELAEAWFESAAILLTTVEDPQRGITALEQALAYGFRDAGAAAALLASERLLERDRVAALLAASGLPGDIPE